MWIGYEFDEEIAVVELSLAPIGHSTGLARVPKTFELQCSDDG